MRYVSTRGRSPPVSFSEALLASLGPDGGLYVPEALPTLPGPPADLSLRSVGRWLLAPFLEGDVLRPHLDELVDHAFSFEAPLVRLSGGVSLLELFHGPTSAFKDYGARFLAAAMARLRSGERLLTILVATSGDTGGAVAAALHHLPGTRVVVLYPDGLVSPRQAHQLGSFGDNVTALRVAGTFDDCQALVKGAFADAQLRDQVPLASANSISLGRWLPQAVYAARAALVAPGARFVIPTGNLGNACAAVLARDLGLPLGPLVLACNANQVLPEGFAAHAFRPRPSLPTLANAMDVGAPSNLERLLHLHPQPWDDGIEAVSVDDEAIRRRIRTTAQQGTVVCPHTAVGLEAAARHAGESVVYATAHPAKFETIVEPLVGHRVEPPPALAAMLARPSHAEALVADLDALVRWLRPA